MLDRFRAATRALLGRVATKAAIGLRMTASTLQAAWTDITFSNLVKHGYKGNAAVWACVRVWATTFPEPELRVRRRTDSGREWLGDHAASLLMARPNSWMGEDMFWQYVITYLAVGGNCYVWKERSRSGQVIGLWPLHDGTVSPVPDAEGWLSHYRYDLADGSIPVTLPAPDIIHLMWAPDPQNPIRGIGPLVAAARAVDMGSEAQRYVYAYLKNDASPRTILGLKEPVGAKLADIKRRFAESYGGDNRGGVMVIDEAEATVTRIGANLSELAVENLWNMPEAWISAAFEVPAIKAGLSIGLQRGYSGANADALNSDFTVTRLVPRWRMVAGQFTRNLLAEFDPDPALTMEFDLSAVQALREDEVELRASINASVTAGWMTINEARARAGLDRDEGGDVFLRAMSSLEQPTGGAAALSAATAILAEATQATGAPASPATGVVSDDPAAQQVQAGESADPSATLNGAQISSLVQLISSIGSGAGKLPRATVVKLIVTAFALPVERVEELLAEIPAAGLPRQLPRRLTIAQAKADTISRADYLAARRLSQEIEEEKLLTVEEYEGQIAEELALIGQRIAEALTDG